MARGCRSGFHPTRKSRNKDNPHQYVGQLGYYTHYQEPGLGLLQLGVRYYDLALGRFTQKDPAKDGMNWYAYVEGNPITLFDPHGMKALPLNDQQWKQISCHLQALCACFSQPKRGRDKGYDLLRKHFCDPKKNRRGKYDYDDGYLAGGRNTWWGPFWTGITLGRDSGLGNCPKCGYDGDLTNVLIHEFLHFDDDYWYAFIEANKIPCMPYTGEDSHIYYNTVARMWIGILKDCLEREMNKCCK